MPGRAARPRELGVLGQKAVAGMNRIHADIASDLDDAGDVEVSPDRLARLADAISLIGLESMQCKPILVRIDGDRSDAQFVGRAKHPDGDLAAVGDKQFLEW